MSVQAREVPHAVSSNVCDELHSQERGGAALQKPAGEEPEEQEEEEGTADRDACG